VEDRQPDPDAELVSDAQAAADGDHRPFEALVARYQEKVVTNCRYMTRSSADAEDLAQDVFLKAYFGLPGFGGRSSFKSWLLRIKANHCLNFLKRRAGEKRVDIDDVSEAASELHVEPKAESLVHAVDERGRIVAVLDLMSDTLRVPLILRDLDGMAYQEIADVLGVRLSAAKMRIKRARETFQEMHRETESSRGSDT